MPTLSQRRREVLPRYCPGNSLVCRGAVLLSGTANRTPCLARTAPSFIGRSWNLRAAPSTEHHGWYYFLLELWSLHRTLLFTVQVFRSFMLRIRVRFSSRLGTRCGLCSTWKAMTRRLVVSREDTILSLTVPERMANGAASGMDDGNGVIHCDLVLWQGSFYETE